MRLWRRRISFFQVIAKNEILRPFGAQNDKIDRLFYNTSYEKTLFVIHHTSIINVPRPCLPDVQRCDEDLRTAHARVVLEYSFNAGDPFHDGGTFCRISCEKLPEK